MGRLAAVRYGLLSLLASLGVLLSLPLTLMGMFGPFVWCLIHAMIYSELATLAWPSKSPQPV